MKHASGMRKKFESQCLLDTRAIRNNWSYLERDNAPPTCDNDNFTRVSIMLALYQRALTWLYFGKARIVALEQLHRSSQHSLRVVLLRNRQVSCRVSSLTFQETMADSRNDFPIFSQRLSQF